MKLCNSHNTLEIVIAHWGHLITQRKRSKHNGDMSLSLRNSQKTKNGDIIKVLCTDPLAEMDFRHYCEQSKFKYIKCSKNKNEIIIFYQIIKN
mgnify:CR=1 FL=1